MRTIPRRFGSTSTETCCRKTTARAPEFDIDRARARTVLGSHQQPAPPDCDPDKDLAALKQTVPALDEVRSRSSD